MTNRISYSTIVFGLAIFSVSTATVQAQFDYISNNSTITLTKFMGSGGMVTIPSQINGLPVTSIGSDTFTGCATVTSVVIPESVERIEDGIAGGCSLPFGAFAYSAIANVTMGNGITQIGDVAFFGCTNLVSVMLPESVTNVGAYAFSGCSRLTNVTVPNSVTFIGVLAFSGCSSLATLTVDPQNQSYSSRGGVLFDKNQTTLLECSGETGLYTVPTSVTSIGDVAFFGCSGLTSVIIPNSVTSIGRSAFVGCSSLTNVSIPNSVTSIGDWAFEACSNLTTVTIPSSVTSIGAQWFYGCSGLTSVSIPNSVTSIGDGAFDWCGGLTNINIPNRVTSIGYATFQGCSRLTSITIPTSIISMADWAFSDCSSLNRVSFEGNAPVLGGSNVFTGDKATVYYLPGTTGWGTTFADRPTAPWVLPNPVILTTSRNFGIQTNQFGFRISWATNASVVIEATTSLSNPVWSPVGTNTLVNGWSDFSEAEWKDHSARFYRVRQW